jgi:hypothetical protein
MNEPKFKTRLEIAGLLFGAAVLLILSLVFDSFAWLKDRQ